MSNGHRTTIEDEATAPTIENAPELSPEIKTLKEAFPDVDVEVIEAILASQGGRMEGAFEILLGMSDPTYKVPTEELTQLQQDEEYARRLAREGDAHYPQNNRNAQQQRQQQQQYQQQQQQQQPIFNFQEELPIIKEKVIEAGTAVKNKITSLYNQFLAGPADYPQQSGSRANNSLLESGIGNLSLLDNDRAGANQRANTLPQRNYSQERNQTNFNHKINASTATNQILSDEEFARRLAREDAELAEAIALSAASDTINQQKNSTKPIITEDNIKSSVNKDIEQDDEVTFSAIGKSDSLIEKEKTNKVDEDDLDDLFDKEDDTNIDDILEDIVDDDDSVDDDKNKSKDKKAIN